MPLHLMHWAKTPSPGAPGQTVAAAPLHTTPYAGFGFSLLNLPPTHSLFFIRWPNRSGADLASFIAHFPPMHMPPKRIALARLQAPSLVPADSTYFMDPLPSHIRSSRCPSIALIMVENLH
jgi:hypothetical protein